MENVDVSRVANVRSSCSAVRTCGSSIVKSSCMSSAWNGVHDDSFFVRDVVYSDSVKEYVCRVSLPIAEHAQLYTPDRP